MDFCYSEGKVKKVKSEIIWGSNPVEADYVTMQFLDKISGKVSRIQLRIGEAFDFGSISVILRRCFKNPKDEIHEAYAFIEIYEKNELIYSNWMFASSPSINLFIHSLYDLRIEF